MTDETWKQIEKYPTYAVSSHGRVKNITTDRVLKQTKHLNGYLYVDLYKDGRKRSLTVHSLVAEAYVGSRPEGHQVNHLDQDPLNNHADNLAWTTPSENVRHSLLNRAGGRAKLTPSDVLEILGLAKTHPIDEIAARFGIGVTTARKVVRRAAWSYVPSNN